MINRKSATPSLTDEIEALKARLLPPRRPNSLVAAERLYRAARKHRNEVSDLMRQASQHAVTIGATSATPDMRRLDVELQEAEQRVTAARSNFERERAGYAETVLQAVGPNLTVASAVLYDALDQLDRAVGPLVDLDRQAEQFGLDASRTRLLRAAPHLQRLVYEGRRLLNGTR